jgi:hypothetical protein
VEGEILSVKKMVVEVVVVEEDEVKAIWDWM